MTTPIHSGSRAIPALLLLAGAGALVLSVGVDLLGLGDPAHFGIHQALIAATGMVLILNGLAARSPAVLEAWRATPREVVLRMAVRFLAISVQLGLLFLVIREYEIENRAFYDIVAVLAFAGFGLHFFVPAVHRMFFFLLLSCAAILLTLGLASGVWLLGIGTALIGICHLPLRLGVRVALLVASGAGLAFLRGEPLLAPWSHAVWPILGSMFMFRLAVYLYDLEHPKVRPTPASSLSYFFLLPNVVFPLFPVVDYNAYRRTYYDTEQFAIYQRGIEWIFRGVVQLIAYRLIYHYAVVSPSAVSSPADLAQHIVANFLLYVRVSGQFHLIVGLLHLFGFNLPETHRGYFLASSFTDFWRRINIYWKDFMQKLVFYPVYFRLRKRGETTALVLGTLAVFAVTWMLHSYQWFWLLGTFPLTLPDTLFWGILALLLIANTLIETRRGRARSLGKPVWSLRRVASVGVRTAGTFLVISLLWSLWTSPSVADWLGLVSLASAQAGSGWNGALAMLLGLALGGMIVAAAQWITRRREVPSGDGFTRSVLWTAAGTVVFYLAAEPQLTDRLSPATAEIAARLKSAELNKPDATLLQRGYYENLIGVSRYNSQLWEVYMHRPIDWQLITDTEAGRKLDGLMALELVPGKRIVFRGAILSTNRWGMRDQEYARERPAGAFRIAMLGASTTMGWSVGDDESFEQLVERRLNREGLSGSGFERVESLNFAVPGYSPPEYLAQLDRVRGFGPHALFLTAQDNDVERTLGRLVDHALNRVATPYDSLQAVARAAVEATGSRPEAIRRLRRDAEGILAWFYREMVLRCRAHGVIPVWFYLPQLEREASAEDKELMFRTAREAGFVILDLSGVFAGRSRDELIVSEWDFHPNALGHRLLADRLFQEVRATPAVFSTP